MNAVDFVLLFLVAVALFSALKLRKRGCGGDCSDCSFCKKSGKDKNDRYKKNRHARRL